MASKKNAVETTTPAAMSETEKPRKRRWMRPQKRAEGYAKERKAGVHQRGNHEGEELDDYNKGLRSGYLLCQSDHAGSYKFKKAINEGKTVEEAAIISQTIGKRNGGNK